MELKHVEGSGLFAKDMFPGGESLDAEFCVGVGMSGYIDGIYIACEKDIQCCGYGEDGEFLGVGSSAIEIAAPDGSEVGVFHGLKTMSETGSGAAGTNDAKANGLIEVRHGNRVARGVLFSFALFAR